jgi:hypothetical protein
MCIELRVEMVNSAVVLDVVVVMVVQDTVLVVTVLLESAVHAVEPHNGGCTAIGGSHLDWLGFVTAQAVS